MASTSDSAAEGLKKILGQLGQLLTLPDADPQFIIALQMGITKFLQQAYAGNAGGGGGAPGLGGPPPGPTGPPAGMPPQMGGPPPGMMGLSLTGPNSGGGPEGAPNADELRRLLGAGQTT